jgi:hypothetical protein
MRTIVGLFLICPYIAVEWLPGREELTGLPDTRES